MVFYSLVLEAGVIKFRMIYQDMYPRMRSPHRDASTWAFSIGGSVQHPLILSYRDLLRMPMVEVTCAVLCAGNPYDESAVEQAMWRGVPLPLLLKHVASNAGFALIHNAAGYNTSLSMDWLQRAILAVEQNGSPLTIEQGYPARLIVPGLYGYKSPRWIERVELSDSPKGFWESRGWGGNGVTPTIAAVSTCRIHGSTANGVTLEGFAYSGAARVSSVELSINHAAWMPVDFEPAPRAQLIEWRVHWTPTNPGEHFVRARAGDDSGFVQTEEAPRSLFELTQDTLHSILVHVME